MKSEIKVQATRIIGTNTVVYSAWERSSLTGNHQTITTIDGEWYGRIGTNRIGADIEALPGGSDERIAACRSHREAHAQRAYAAILAEFPNLKPDRIDGGEMETWS